MNTLAVLVGLVAVNILAVFFYQEIGSTELPKWRGQHR